MGKGRGGEREREEDGLRLRDSFLGVRSIRRLGLRIRLGAGSGRGLGTF